jgi:uncharacterized protein DUF4062
MEKRYQVFVSSTYTDLADARREVVQTLLQMDCIPAGMELFPAADEEQLQFIRKVIDDCDYYILIVAGRYGSIDPHGVSYTEREFDYAVEQNIPVLAFVHADPSTLPPHHQEADDGLKARLESFRMRIQTGRMCKAWSKASDLAGLVALSMPRAIRNKPRPGWIRGLADDPSALLEQINDLRKRNEDLLHQLQTAAKSQEATVPNLAPLTDTFVLTGSYTFLQTNTAGRWNITWSWSNIFGVIGPDLLTWTNDRTVNDTLARAVLESQDKRNASSASVDRDPFNTVRIQMLALGLVDIKPMTTTSNTTALFWAITGKGREVLMNIRTVKATT